jgi:hypothetical protein
VTVSFDDPSTQRRHYFQQDATQISIGLDNYHWHAAGQNGYAQSDRPAVTSIQSPGKDVQYTLPKSSITVLRGKIQ